MVGCWPQIPRERFPSWHIGYTTLVNRAACVRNMRCHRDPATDQTWKIDIIGPALWSRFSSSVLWNVTMVANRDNSLCAAVEQC